MDSVWSFGEIAKAVAVLAIASSVFWSGCGAMEFRDSESELNGMYRSRDEALKEFRIRKICVSMASDPQRWADLKSPCDNDLESLTAQMDEQEEVVRVWGYSISARQKLIKDRQDSILWRAPVLVAHLF